MTVGSVLLAAGGAGLMYAGNSMSNLGCGGMQIVNGIREGAQAGMKVGAEIIRDGNHRSEAQAGINLAVGTGVAFGSVLFEAALSTPVALLSVIAEAGGVVSISLGAGMLGAAVARTIGARPTYTKITAVAVGTLAAIGYSFRMCPSL